MRTDGRVTDINMLVDLETANGKIIKDINSKQLLKIRSISVGDYVINATWIGRVDKVIDCVSIVFNDGSKYEVTAMDHEMLVPVSPNIIDDSQYPYYPGQRVQVVPSKVSRSTRWFCGSWRENQDEGTVSGVDAGFVYVDWISSAHFNHDLSASPLSCLQEAKDLTLLSCFSHSTWQLGDWCMLSFADYKGAAEELLHTSNHGIIKSNWKLEKGFERGKFGSRLEEIFVIIKRTKVDVVWQDGTYSFGLDSQTLLPVGVANAHEFWPHQFVLEKGTSGNSQRWGVVRGMDAKDLTVKVQWRNMAVNQVNGFDGEQMEETVSAYELVEHPDYSYSFGDIVSKVVQNQFGDQADKGHIISETGFGTEADSKGKNCSWDLNKYPSTYYLSCIGVVIGFKDGDVDVKWASGNPTKVAPYEIYCIDKYEESATTPLYEENTKDFNQETFVHETQSNSHKGKDLLNFNDADGSEKKFPQMPTSFFYPQSAFGFFSSIASSVLGSLGSRSLLSQESSGCISHDAKEHGILLEKEVLETCNHCTEQDQSELQSLQIFETTIKEKVKEIEETKACVMPRSTETSDRLKQFDMVSDCSDHYFLGESKVLAVSQVKRSWLKKVQQEWSILEKNLPETIYARVYEERMDLLQAALVGAPGTPYHDGLFFFDIFLPSEYPYEPPLVHYRSWGLRLNPNLYESGKVCLSLLNTWTGSDTEVWNLESSTILQVLLSLQALVLNEKPYFNEAGYDKQIGSAEAETNSASYNENAFLVTCQSMLYILRKPPKHFEALVKEHFSRRAKIILSACNAYMEGTPVGSALECGGNGHDENLKGSSTGFKIMLAKLFPKLVEAFSDQGIECTGEENICCWGTNKHKCTL